VPGSLEPLPSFCKEARTLFGGARYPQRRERSSQPAPMKVLMLNTPLVTGQRLEGAVGVMQPSIVCGHRLGGHAIDPGQ